MSEEKRWRWIALILGAVLLMVVSCVSGSILGGLVGYAMGGQPRHEMMEEPHSPWEEPIVPLPPEQPEPPSWPRSGQPWLGVTYFMSEDGAEISQVIPGSPADEAGLLIGDVIARVDRRRVTDMNTLSEIIQRYNVGDDVTLTILRDGESMRIEVRLGARIDR